MELLLFLVLTFSSRVAGKAPGLESSFQESLIILEKAAKAIQIKDVVSQQNGNTKELQKSESFKPRVYIVRVTEPPMATPVQGFKDSQNRKKDPFFSPIPIADKPDIMKRIQVIQPEEQAGSNGLLVACATIFVIILLIGAAAIMGHCYYVLNLPPHRSDFDFSITSLDEEGLAGVCATRRVKQVAFYPKVIESLDEMPTLTDESARTMEITRSESEIPASALDTSARPASGAPPPPIKK